jgi:hypothetical protein
MPNPNFACGFAASTSNFVPALRAGGSKFAAEARPEHPWYQPESITPQLKHRVVVAWLRRRRSLV